MGKILIGLTSEILFFIVGLLIYAEERNQVPRKRSMEALSVHGVFEASC